MTTAESLYKGRKPKLRETQAGNQSLRQATVRRGEKTTPQSVSVKGHYDVSDSYLRGSAGGEAHPNYVRSTRQRGR